MLLDKKFDFICSIGEDCACTSYLRRFNLQGSSYPFNWVCNASIKNRLNLIYDDFKCFLNKEDLVFLDKGSYKSAHERCHNIKNDLWFPHDFPSDEPLDSSYDAVKAKYERRCHRLFQEIDKANFILFVCFTREKLIGKDDLLMHHAKLQDKFKTKDINLLIIEKKEINGFEYDEINDSILKISYQSMLDSSAIRAYTKDISIKCDAEKASIILMSNKKANQYIFSKIKFNYTNKQSSLLA